MADPANSGPTTAWNAFIALAGAAAGLVAVVYFVGAVTLWARFRTAALPADIAIEHYPRTQVAAIGVRGVAVVAGLIVLAVGVLYLILLLVALRRPRSSVRQQNVIAASAIKVKKLTLGWTRVLVLISVFLVVAAAFLSWRWLAGAIALIPFTAVAMAYLYTFRQESPRPRLWMIVSVVLAVSASGICWQVDAPIYVQTVIVKPTPRYLPKDVPVPYFGQSEKHIYVAEVQSSQQQESGRWQWEFTRQVLEVPRANRRLVFPGQLGSLSPAVSRPARAVWQAVT